MNPGRGVDVLVLAGGKSRRMGADKALLELDGTPLISGVVNAVAHIGNVFVVGGSDALLETVRNHCPHVTGLSHVADVAEDPGPFGAIVEGLRHTCADEVVVMSCDLASLRREEVDRLLAARRAFDSDIAVPLVTGRRQWHSLALRRRILPSLEERLNGGTRSLFRGFSGYCETLVVSNDARFFADVDTPEDLERFATDES